MDSTLDALYVEDAPAVDYELEGLPLDIAALDDEPDDLPEPDGEEPW